MNEKIKTVLQKINMDEELAAKYSACRTPDECYALASSIEDGFTKEEFVDAVEQIKAVIEGSADLTDEDLKKIAGGIDWSDVGEGALITGTISITVTAASAI